MESKLRQKETALAELVEAKNNASSALKRSEEALQRSEYARRRAEQAAASAETRSCELQTALQETEQRLEFEFVRRAKAAIAHSSEKADTRVLQLTYCSFGLQTSQSSLETSSLQVTQLSSQLAAFELSTLWRATWPVRRLSNRLPRSLRRTVRRGAKLAWWTGTLQLPRRYTEWRSVKRGSLVPAIQSTPGAGAEGIPANLPSTPGDHLIASLRGNAELAVTAVQQPTSEIKRITRSLLMARLHAFLASGETLDLPINERPTVSILIVLYNGAELTFACLESLRESCGAKQSRSLFWTMARPT